MDKPDTLQDLRDALRCSLHEIANEMFDTFERIEAELLLRERAVQKKEKEIEAFVRELEVFEADLKATDTRSRYVVPQKYEVEDVSYVAASELPDRERHILATLQVMADKDERGRMVVEGSNKDLSRAASTRFDPVSPNAISACLTRLNHKDLIFVESLNGRGYPRRIVLKALLETPKAFTDYKSFG